MVQVSFHLIAEQPDCLLHSLSRQVDKRPSVISCFRRQKGSSRKYVFRGFARSFAAETGRGLKERDEIGLRPAAALFNRRLQA
jgi:hypothetical protein